MQKLIFQTIFVRMNFRVNLLRDTDMGYTIRWQFLEYNKYRVLGNNGYLKYSCRYQCFGSREQNFKSTFSSDGFCIIITIPGAKNQITFQFIYSGKIMKHVLDLRTGNLSLGTALISRGEWFRNILKTSIHIKTTINRLYLIII